MRRKCDNRSLQPVICVTTPCVLRDVPGRFPTPAAGNIETVNLKNSRYAGVAPGVAGPLPAQARNPALDGLRGVAVLAVIAYHLWPQAVPGGFLGVDLFFVLSGYLITRGLLGRLDAGKSVGLRGFWVRRARRLIPAMLLMLVGATALAILAGRELPAGLRAQWAGALTYSSNWLQVASGNSYFASSEPPYFQHLWSLAIEEQFYLLWPVLLVVLMVLLHTKGRMLAATLTLGVAAAATMTLCFDPAKDSSALYFGTWTHGFGLLIGAAAAIHASSTSIAEKWQPKGRNTRALAAGTFFGGMLVAIAMLPDTSAITYRGGMFLFCLASAGVILYLERGGSLLWSALGQRHLRWVGNRSYGLYLWHWPLLVLARGLVPPQAAMATALSVLAATFLAAALSWHLVEHPIMRDGFRATLGVWRWRVRERIEHLFSGGPGRYSQIIPVAVLLLVPLCAVSALVASPAQSSLQQQLTRAQTLLSEQQEDHASIPEAEPGPTAGTEARKPAGKEPETLSKKSAPGREVTAIGDSVMLASTSELLKRLPGISINAVVGAQLRDAPETLERLRDSGKLRRIVVLALGTNGDMPAGTLETVRAIIGSERKLLLVTVHAARGWAGSVNEKYRTAAAKYPNVQLVDWEHRAMGVDDFARDGIHPGPHGAREYTRMLEQALAGS